MAPLRVKSGQMARLPALAVRLFHDVAPEVAAGPREHAAAPRDVDQAREAS